MLNRTEARFLAAGLLGPAVIAGALLLASHPTPTGPAPAIVVQPVPVYAPPAPVSGWAVSA